MNIMEAPKPAELVNKTDNIFTDFSKQSTAGVGATTEYLSSNTLVAKFAFIILVIIGFIILLNLGVILISYLFSPPANPYLVSGLIAGNTGTTISQNPALTSLSQQVTLSNNQETGMEFTWSVWLFITDLGINTTNSNLGAGQKYQFVFNKGDLNFGKDNITQVNNGPGLYISPYQGNGTTTLHVIMNTSDNNDNSDFVDVKGIPLKKWVNVMIRLENTMLDVYINGTISGRITLQKTPKQNYNDVNVCQGGGFNGNLSDLRYFNHALNVVEINAIVNKGPNTTPSSSSSSPSAGYNYLSSLWYSKNL